MALEKDPSAVDLRTFLQQTKAMVWTADGRGYFNYFNPAWLLFRGRSIEAESGKGWLSGVHTHDEVRVLRILENALERREAFSLEYRLQDSMGVYRWLISTGNPVYDSQGQFTGITAISLDNHDTASRCRSLEKEILGFKQDAVILPVCSACHKVRPVNGGWTSLEDYCREHTRISFTHSICPDCNDKTVPGMK